MNDELDPHSQSFVDTAVDRLRASEEEVSPEALARLRDARRTAVAAVDETPQTSWWFNWMPYAATATVVLSVALWQGMWQGGVDPLPPFERDELMLAADMELLDELEFVAWLAESGELLEESSTDAG